MFKFIVDLFKKFLYFFNRNVDIVEEDDCKNCFCDCMDCIVDKADEYQVKDQKWFDIRYDKIGDDIYDKEKLLSNPYFKEISKIDFFMFEFVAKKIEEVPSYLYLHIENFLGENSDDLTTIEEKCKKYSDWYRRTTNTQKYQRTKIVDDTFRTTVTFEV